MSSRIITLGEHKWELPPYPISQDEVLFSKESKHNQYWRRDNTIPDFFYDFVPGTPQYDGTIINSDHTIYDDNTGMLKSISREDTEELLRILKRELWRREHGVWMMNDGDLTWLAPHHYFQLQWCAMKGYKNPDDGSNYGQYREFQAHYQYFLVMCLHDIACGGDITVKSKKTGLTQLIASNYLNRSTMEREKNLYMMSKSGDDIISTNMDYYFFAFDKLPPIFRPTVQNRTLMTMNFGNARVRPGASKANMIAQLEAGKGFNTKVIGTKTVETAFDGPWVDEAWVDEFTKLEKPYPEAVYKKTKETVKLQGVIQPFRKIHYTGYTSEDDGRAFHESKKVWDDSLMSTWDPTTKKTRSNLYTYCIPADESQWESFNRYGKPDRAKIRAIIAADRKQLEGDPSALQAEIRQRPLTGEEAWQEGGGGGSVYNNVRLGLRKKIVTEMLDAGSVPFIWGNLEWVGEPMGLVRWVTVPADLVAKGESAMFRWYHPEWMNEEVFNVPIRYNLRDRNDLMRPDENTPHVAAMDPVEEAMKSQVKKGSKVAMTCMNQNDPTLNETKGRVVSGRFFLRYLNRCENPLDDYENLKKMVLWTGCLIVIEANRMWVTTKMIQDGLENFLLVRDRKTKSITAFNRSEHQQLITTTVAGGIDVIGDYIRATKIWMSPPKTSDAFDNMELLEDEEQIKQWMGFKAEDTKESDLGVCSSYNIMAFDVFSVVKQKLMERWRRQKYSGPEMEMAMKMLL